MPTDPRTPVLAGVGQVTHRPSADDPSTWTEPLALMAEALSLAGEDAAGRAGARSGLLDHLDELTAVPSFVWSPHDAARSVATRLGVDARTTRVTGPGGTVPQTALFDAARRIRAGELDVAAVVGAEAIKSRDLARRAGVTLEWHRDDDVPVAPVAFPVPDALSDEERALGLSLPVTTYALFEHALRRDAGRTREEHLAHLDALAARMRAVAASVDGAWLRGASTPVSVTTATPSNRMVSVPYTKLLASNVVVDMGAALLVCSLEAARRAGVPEQSLVFPLRGATAKEQWLVSTRQTLSRSLAMRACADAVLADAAPGGGAPDHVDLYSCFPSAVQLGCDALGLDPLTDSRPPTVTGGMTFFGGPGNNYVTHSIAEMARRLRSAPGTTGLVTGLGWYASTHAWATYGTAPPDGGFVAEDRQPVVDAAALRDADWSFEGTGVVETYTVGHDRDGEPARAVVSVLAPSGARRLCGTEDAALAAAIEAADPLDEPVTVRGETFTLG